MNTRLVWLAYIISGIAGAAIWAGVSVITGEGEYWGTNYFLYALPLMLFLSFAVGFFFPKDAWRWGATLLGAQALLMILESPAANLLPLGLAILAALSVPCMFAAYGGAVVRRSRQRGRLG